MALLKAARAVFAREGYKAANVADIAGEAGLGVGTFYNYFDSKEAVFFEVYVKENQALKARIRAAVDPGADPVTFVSKMLTMNFQEMNANPILREWRNKELFARLESLFAESGEVSRLQASAEEGQLAMIRKWKEGGQMRTDIADDRVMAIFRALPYIELHKEEIGVEHFPDLIREMSELIMRGLAP